MAALALALLSGFAASAQSPVYEFAKQLNCTTTASTVDDSGNIYIGGYFSGAVDFDPGSGAANLCFSTPKGWNDYSKRRRKTTKNPEGMT